MSLYDEMHRAQMDRHEYIARSNHAGMAWWKRSLMFAAAMPVIDLALYYLHSPVYIVPIWLFPFLPGR